MDIIIIGAGIVGLTSAWELAARGHNVTILEAEDGVGTGASFANGGQLSFSYVDPFATPGLIHQLPSIFLGKQSGLSLSPDDVHRGLLWKFKMLRSTRPDQYHHALDELLRLASISSEATGNLLSQLAAHGIDGTPGKLILYDQAAAFENYRTTVEIKKSCGVNIELLSGKECVDLEPSLAPWEESICGGVYSHDDYAVDSYKVSQALAEEGVKSRGVKIVSGHHVQRFEVHQNRVVSVIADEQRFPADVFVLSAGNASQSLAAKLGLDLEIRPIHGFSATIKAKAQAPGISLTFASERMVVTPFKGHLRVAGHAHIGSVTPHRLRNNIEELIIKTRKYFPDAGFFEDPVSTWHGRRPARYNSMPLISDTPVQGMYLNTGHGAYGWTLACGSARLLADRIEQKSHEFSHNSFQYGKT